MKLWKLLLVAGAIAQMNSLGLLSGETLNPRTVPQVAPMTPQEKKNLDTVLTWWREVVYAGHAERAAKYMAEAFIEHSPTSRPAARGSPPR